MKKTAIKKTTEKSVKVKSKLSENQQDFNKVIEVTGKLKKDLKQFKSKVMAMESYFKPHITGANAISMGNFLSNAVSVKIVQSDGEPADKNNFCEDCQPKNIESIYFAFKFTVRPMVDYFEGMIKDIEKNHKDTLLFMNKYPENNREILRKIITMEIENDKVDVFMSHSMEDMKSMEKQADKLIIKQNKEELKKGKGKKIIKLVN